MYFLRIEYRISEKVEVWTPTSGQTLGRFLYSSIQGALLGAEDFEETLREQRAEVMATRVYAISEPEVIVLERLYIDRRAIKASPE